MRYKAPDEPSKLKTPKKPKTVFNYTRPWIYPKQLSAIFECKDPAGLDARIATIEASTKTGKTIGCVIWLFEQAYAFGAPGKNFWWIAPVSGQASIAYRRMKAGMPPLLFTSNDTHLTVTLGNGAVIWFKSAEKPDNLYGEDVWAAVIDEASRMRQEAWWAIRSTLTATRGKLRIIGNVKGRKNWFYALCRRAQAGGKGMSYAKIIAADAVAAGVLSEEEVAGAKTDLPENVYKELYLAEPSDDGGNPFGLKAIELAIKPLSTGKPIVWGWDLGKSEDWTVGIALDVSGHVCRVERFQKPWPQTIDAIKLATGFDPALVDSTGVGDPIVDDLQRSMASNFVGFKFTAPSKQRIMEGLAVAIQRQDIGYPDGTIKDELDEFEYQYTRTGVKYSAPDGFHDDCVCALALAWAHKGSDKDLDVWRKLAAGIRK